MFAIGNYFSPMTIKSKAAASALSKHRWSKIDSAGRAAHAKLMTDARWAGKTPEQKLEQGRKMAEGRKKAREARNLSS